MNGEPSTLVSPGIWGFLAFFVLAVALYLLMRNMNARMRRMSYRAEELQREAEAEAAGRQGAERGLTDPQGDGSPESGDDPGPEGQTGHPHR
jgi:hypothetical protein